MLLFVLGRQPEIGFAELRAVLGESVQLSGQVAFLDKEVSFDFNRLGSAVKVAKVIDDSWDRISDHLPDSGKVTLGLSTYETKLTPGALNKIASDIKRQRGSVRVVPTSETALSSATVFHNKLTKPNKIEFILTQNGDQKLLAQTIFVQDINAYTFRDRSRPKRDARVGMLPPKLAQTMINLAVGASKSEPKRLLDPFCGTGVILQEAALMNYEVYGTDLEPRMVEYSAANLDWLKHTHRLDFNEKLEVGDATSHHWSGPIDAVATETYLGKPFTSLPAQNILTENINNCEVILSKFLKNLHGQISDQTGLTIAVPCWFVNGRTYHLDFTKNLAALGFEQVYYSDGKNPLVYHREGQVVGRDLLVLRKTLRS